MARIPILHVRLSLEDFTSTSQFVRRPWAFSYERANLCIVSAEQEFHRAPHLHHIAKLVGVVRFELTISPPRTVRITNFPTLRNWCPRMDSNHRPLLCRSTALARLSYAGISFKNIPMTGSRFAPTAEHLPKQFWKCCHKFRR